MKNNWKFVVILGFISLFLLWGMLKQETGRPKGGAPKNDHVSAVESSPISRGSAPAMEGETLSWNVSATIRDLSFTPEPLPGQQGWPPIKIDYAGLATPPEIPSIPPITVSWSEAYQGAELARKQLLARMDWLFRSVPDTEFQALIASHQTAMDVMELDPGIVAQFVVLPEGAPELLWWPNTTTPLPLFEFNGEYLFNMSTEEDVIKGWLFLVHEAMHFKQFLRGGKNAPTFMVDHEIKPDECSMYFMDEIEAHLAMCGLAEAWGVPALGNGRLCFYKDKPDLLTQWYLAWMIMINNYPQCQDEWMKSYADGTLASLLPTLE